uniref:Uncharacterized protein n=1 Tax=Anguilla anguilla TaxID=7936 RepID=A0A0E9XPT8_ANGAN
MHEVSGARDPSCPVDARASVHPVSRTTILSHGLPADHAVHKSSFF